MVSGPDPVDPSPSTGSSDEVGQGPELKAGPRRPWPPVRPVLRAPVSQPPAPLPQPMFVPRPQPTKAIGRRFVTQGEPTVKTGDGLFFSLTRPGAYTALASASGDFVMQQRVSQTPDGRHYNTAIGLRIGEDVLSFDTEGGTHAAGLSLNGRPLPLEGTMLRQVLPGGTALKYDPGSNKVHLQTPQGDRVTVRRTTNPAGTHFLNVTIDVAEKRAGMVRGLLGNLNEEGLARQDALMRDGSRFPGAVGSSWKTPEAFVEEWRSQPDESIL